MQINRPKILWSLHMFSSLLKVMPILTLGLGVGLEAQSSQKNTKMQPTYRTASAVCGVNEGECCLARSCKCAMGGALEMDFLYWRADNTGFTFAYQQKDPSSTHAYVDNIGSVVRLDSDWAPGFRLGGGWNSDFDRWDVFVDWTWFKDSSTKSRSLDGITSATDPRGFYPLQSVNDSGTQNRYRDVSASWHLQHNVVDLELGRAFYITKALSLRPHCGLRSGWINQKFKSVFSLPINSAAHQEYDFHGKNNFSGVGPRVGIHSQWHIDSSSWSILGKASTSLLLGQTKTRYHNKSLTAGASSFVTERQLKDNFSQLVPNLQIFIGLDWGSCLDCEKYYLGINAGWETNIYWNQFNIPTAIYTNYAPLPGTGNQAVTMEGLTVNVHFDF